MASPNASQILQPHVNKMYWDKIYCKVFSPFFSLKQNEVNSRNWGETNWTKFPEKQKDVWDVFFKIKKKDDGD